MSRRVRRRLSIWPQREMHRQIEYKAEERGVPIIKVDPRYTSKTCPRCGEIKQRRSRVGQVFICTKCGWAARPPDQRRSEHLPNRSRSASKRG